MSQYFFLQSTKLGVNIWDTDIPHCPGFCTSVWRTLVSLSCCCCEALSRPTGWTKGSALLSPQPVCHPNFLHCVPTQTSCGTDGKECMHGLTSAWHISPCAHPRIEHVWECMQKPCSGLSRLREGGGKRSEFSVYILWTEHPLFKKWKLFWPYLKLIKVKLGLV